MVFHINVIDQPKFLSVNVVVRSVSQKIDNYYPVLCMSKAKTPSHNFQTPNYFNDTISYQKSFRESFAADQCDFLPTEIHKNNYHITFSADSGVSLNGNWYIAFFKNSKGPILQYELSVKGLQDYQCPNKCNNRGDCLG